MANKTHSLANLPDELLADITFRVAKSSVIDGASLGKVNKPFRRHWKIEGVRRVCNLGPLEFVSAIGDCAEITSLSVAMTQLCQAGNPYALYREKIISYFDNRRTERAAEGQAQLEIAEANGHIKARFLYGMILVCSDLETRDEGFNILATLMQPSLLESMCRMARLSDDLTDKYLPELQEGVKKAVVNLVENHVDCECDYPDGNRDYMDASFRWSAETVAYDPLNDPMCRNVFGTVKRVFCFILFMHPL